MSYLQKYIIFAVILLVALGGSVIYQIVGCQKLARGASGFPAAPGDVQVAYTKDGPDLNAYEAGDVILYRQPGHKENVIMGRIVGMPGDLIAGDGKLYINEVQSNLGGSSRRVVQGSAIVPRDTVWVLVDVDDRGTVDSRRVGPINRWAILGKAMSID